MIYSNRVISPILSADVTDSSFDLYRISANRILSYNKFDLNYYGTYFFAISRLEIKDENNEFGFGAGRVNVYRNDLSIAYRFRDLQKKFNINLSGHLAIDYLDIFTLREGERRLWRVIDTDISPDYRGNAFLETVEGFKFTPGIGASFEYNFWWRFYIIGSAEFYYNPTAYQKLYFEYTYKNVRQPDGETWSTGTATFLSIGFGIKLFEFEIN